MVEEIRVVMFGKTGVGKSFLGNNILDKNAFQSEASAKSITKEAKKGERMIDNDCKLVLIDTPGLFDTTVNDNMETAKILTKTVKEINPGPHIVIFVLSIGRFTVEERAAIEFLKDLLGNSVKDYLVIVFTGKDHLEFEKKDLETYIDEADNDLKNVLSQCKGLMTINNRAPRKEVTRSVDDLLRLIKRVYLRNNKEHYTDELLTEAKKKFEEKLRKLEEEAHKKERELEEKNKNLEKEKRENKNKMEDLSKKEKEVRKKYEDEKERMRMLEMENNNTLEALRLERERLRKQEEEAKKKYEDVKKENEETRMREEEARQKYENVKKENQETRMREERAKKKYEDVKKDNQETRKREEEAKKKCNDIRTEAETHRKRAEEAQSRVHKSEEEKKAFYKTQLEKTGAKIQEIQREKDRKIKEQDQEIKSLMKENAKLKADLENKQSLMDQAEEFYLNEVSNNQEISDQLRHLREEYNNKCTIQ